jgi:hypothetical protein
MKKILKFRRDIRGLKNYGAGAGILLPTKN